LPTGGQPSLAAGCPLAMTAGCLLATVTGAAVRGVGRLEPGRGPGSSAAADVASCLARRARFLSWSRAAWSCHSRIRSAARAWLRIGCIVSSSMCRAVLALHH
jgi:hypothetical protein